jgi:hypothetical protein
VTRLLYITGWCRSGSTLLGNLLGELDGVAHVGELAYLWANGVLRHGTNTTCGCGEDLLTCPIWAKVLARLTPGGQEPAAAATERVRWHAAHLRTRHTQARLAEAQGRTRPSFEVRRTLHTMTSTYATIGDVAGAEVIVDSSNYPAEAAAACGLSELDVRVLHLVRDPRATAYSWRRAKEYIPAMGVTRSTAYWTGFNLASQRIGAAFPDRYLRVRYEDFVARPAAALASITSWAGLPGSPPLAEDGTISLGENHTVTGNPDRLRRGKVHIRPDDAWMSRLPAGEAMISTAIALPLLARYGYPLSGRK